MGLYDERLAALEERRSSQAQSPRSRSADVQSLLFSRNGWTAASAKSWARSHGYKSAGVDVTDQHIRIRQFDSKGFKTHRTIPFGRGIRAVIAKEGSSSMAVVKSSRRRKKKNAAPAKRRKRRASTARRTRSRKTKVSAAPKRRRRRRVRESAVVAAPRRRRRRVVRAWKGNSAGHATAAKKGWRRKRRAKKTTTRRRRRRVSESVVAAPRKRRAKRRTKRRTKRRMSEPTVMMAPRRRRRRKMRASVQSPRRHRRRHVRSGRKMFASMGGSGGFDAMQLLVATITGGIGYTVADGLDRFLATYDPAGATRPADKFTSDGTGTLANTLNIAARPSWARLGAGAGMFVLPAVGSLYVKNKTARAAAEGFTLGAGISLFKTVWNTVVMPLLIPKDTTVPGLQKSFIARLYPTEVAAKMNLDAAKLAVSSAGGAGALSGAPQQQPQQLGVGDVGPFALQGDSPYPDAAQALRRGVGYPSVENAWGTGGDSRYPTAAQALRAATGVSAGPPPTGGPDASWNPGPPPGPGPGPQAQPHKDCGCIGAADLNANMLGEATETPFYKLD